jgi:hypothetical protein
MTPRDAGASPAGAQSRAGHSYTNPAARSPAPKLIVAVHGIGDQTAYATIQSVALRVSAYLGHEIAPPLGRFYFCPQDGPSTEPATAVPQMMTRDDPPFDGIGLAEAYWAPIPRQVATQKYVLEETKRWARSVAARVAYPGKGQKYLPPKTAERLVVVLDEMIETIRTLQRVSFVAEKAGLFKFDLDQLLTDFVGDVQLVADFQVYRQRILDEFDSTMTRTLGLAKAAGADRARDAEIYIIAHSEGTVVTFVALLEALADPNKYPWIENVAGLMTIGSPIETHHLLWPALWQTAGLKPAKDSQDIHIEWHNYMDYGDPIAYELTETTKWLRSSGFAQHLMPPVTHAFSRYLLPGKAHVDYWADGAVFDHFLGNVVRLKNPREKKFTRLHENVTRYVNRLTNAKGEVRSKAWVPTFAFAFPYAIVAALLFVGAYFLEHSVVGSLPAAERDAFSIGRVFQDVLGIGSLMFGITAAARLPRLSDSLRWWLAGWGLLFASIVIFGVSTHPATMDQMGWWLSRAGWDPSACVLTTTALRVGCDAGVRFSAIGVGFGAVLVAGLSGAYTRVSPRYGHYMLPALGVLGALGVVSSLLRQHLGHPDASASLWPVMLALVLFFYVWWLSALLFDLSFIWRRYARHSVVRERLVELTRSTESRATAPSTN